MSQSDIRYDIKVTCRQLPDVKNHFISILMLIRMEEEQLSFVGIMKRLPLISDYFPLECEYVYTMTSTACHIHFYV